MALLVLVGLVFGVVMVVTRARVKRARATSVVVLGVGATEGLPSRLRDPETGEYL